MIKKMYSKACIFVGFLMVSLYSSPLFAQSNVGATAILNVTEDLKKYINPVRNLIYAIAGIVALIGAISVFIKMNNEEQDVKKSIMIIVGSCIFLIAAATALPKFFGYSN